MIDTEDVSFDYPHGRALHGVGFVVRAGAAVALAGPDGAGKSTLMRLIAALDAPGDGRINVSGADTQDDPSGVHARIGYLPPAFGLYDALSVRQCLIYAARSRGVDRGEVEAAVARAAERTGLAGGLDTLAGLLPKGQRRRLGIAQAIVHTPRVLLLDEPAAGLEEMGRAALWALVRGLNADGMTVLVSAPTPGELRDCCDGVLALDQGRLVGGGVTPMPEPEPEPEPPLAPSEEPPPPAAAA